MLTLLFCDLLGRCMIEPRALDDRQPDDETKRKPSDLWTLVPHGQQPANRFYGDLLIWVPCELKERRKGALPDGLMTN
jgi:hypothetical protein